MTASSDFPALTAAAPPAAATFPVVFFDGDRETGIGTVTIDGSVTFKKFQSTISQRIGLPPQQITLSLVRRKKGRVSSDNRRKTPIDNGSDFGTIARERDCFILAVLKRSRRTRSRRSHVDARSAAGEPPTILRRPSPEVSASSAMDQLSAAYGFGSAMFDLEGARSLRIQRERYLMEAAYDGNEPVQSVLGSYHGGVGELKPVECKVCAESTWESPPPFHGCVNDAVTFGFRSRVGPIQRPSKALVEASWA